MKGDLGCCMKIINLTEDELQKLSNYKEDDDFNRESQILCFPWLTSSDDKDSFLLKLLYTTDRQILDNKISTLENLEKCVNTDLLNELVIPHYLVEVDDNIVGFVLPEKKGCTTLGTLLQNNELTKRDKLELVQKVGELLEKVESLTYNGSSFYFSDLHENNFLVNDATKELFCVDLDSATFRDDIALPSYYLIDNPNLGDCSKYSFNVFGIPYPSRDNDLLCYNMMVLSVLAEKNMNVVSVDEYHKYLDYLQDIGLSSWDVDSFRTIYENMPNSLSKIPLDYVSDEILSQTSFSCMLSHGKSK